MMTRKVTLLIVEDSPTQAEGLKMLLEEHGYAVRVARHGKQGLSMARELKPTIVISDVMMPEMDGYTLCRAIKHDPELKTISVILVTTLSSHHDVFKGLECGTDNFITKPYDEKYLLARLNYLLTNQELRERGKLQMGLEIDLNGQRHFITAERQQILDLLISTYGEAVHLNEQLAVKQKDLERSYQTLNALYQVAEGLVHCTVVQEIADQVLEKAMALPGVRAGWIFLRETSAGFRTVATHGLPPQLQTPEFLEFGPCVCQQMLIEGELDKAANVLECERIRVAGGELEGLKY
ncbi:MAG: response regulator, partial [Nitrospirales bacterium]